MSLLKQYTICIPLETCIDGEVRLASDDSREYAGSVHVGRVEICINDQYGTMCDDTWDYAEATVVCRQLGFSPNGELCP